ncbi:hypothetical protein QOT17_003302 [Balamuthia mandrillaris]
MLNVAARVRDAIESYLHRKSSSSQIVYLLNGCHLWYGEIGCGFLFLRTCYSSASFSSLCLFQSTFPLAVQAKVLLFSMPASPARPASAAAFPILGI